MDRVTVLVPFSSTEASSFQVDFDQFMKRLMSWAPLVFLTQEDHDYVAGMALLMNLETPMMYVTSCYSADIIKSNLGNIVKFHSKQYTYYPGKQEWVSRDIPDLPPTSF